MTESSKPTPTAILVGAAILAVVAFVVAGTVDDTAIRILGALVGLTATIGGVVVASKSSRTAGLIGVGAIPLAVLVLGVPIAGLIDTDDASTSADTTKTTNPPRDQLVAEHSLDAQLVEALTHADTMVPNGSASILSLRFGWAPEIAVLDTRSGNKVTASRDGDGWSMPSRSRATERNTFGRADLENLSLSDAAAKVAEGARKIGDSGVVTNQTTIEIRRRTDDDLLLVSFDSDDIMRKIQVDADGNLPDTLDAGAVDTVMVAAARIMKAAGVGARTPLTGFDFKSTIDEATIPAASPVQSSGGIAMDFDDGPVESIVAVPGEFPKVARREGLGYPRTPRFVLSELSQASVLRARDDLMRRNDSPTYDEDVVGFQAGDMPGDSGGDAPARIRISVGPVNGNVEGVYSLNGRFVRDGSW
ncbi:hypothetical protein [Gordonia liuliyuniae]|uniref:Uncharacterized protein n=1 Tax=Gordonia liuliyuniae TaxID=2911517 RepID=A0ABS9IQY0_9ACTN|nr:hypothetical protein [Gordonia liuliyuniae]MCF8587968.1 hypothetical protein [Gordonia liuliyuniae]